MEFRRLLLLSALFCLALLGSHVQASLPAEDYWQTLWPNTLMPKALRDLLQADANTYQTGSGKVSHPTRSKDTIPDGVFVFEHDLHPAKKLNLQFTDRSDERDTVARTFPLYDRDTVARTFPLYDRGTFAYNRGPVARNFPLYNRDTVARTFPLYDRGTVARTFPLYDRGTVARTFPLYDRGTVARTFPLYDRGTVARTFPLYDRGTVARTFPLYRHGTIAKTFPIYDKVSDLTKSKGTIPNGIFFFEHDLLPGKKVNLGKFTKLLELDEYTFIPDTVAKTIPFSSSRLPEILNRFSIEAKSTDAETVKQTLEICESLAINGEEKYCATSLESLVNFAVSKLGKNTRLLSTEFEKETQNRQYTLAEGMKKNGDKAVVCHKMDYPYAVFHCHKIDTRSYTVPLVATGDGTKVKALAVCHTDTTHWNPAHAAFKQLNVMPGTTPICHFLGTDTLLWVPNLALKGVMESSPEDGKR